jgi:microcompartment protein CcmK/EutM
MQLAEVLGSVTATIKTASLNGHRLVVVRPLDVDKSAAAAEVAVDTVSAGPGDLVLVLSGSSARQVPETRVVATDLTVVAIVDAVDIPPTRRADAKKPIAPSEQEQIQQKE